MRRIALIGFLLWLAGTIAIRLQGDRILHTQQPLATLILYAISFVLMALITRRIFSRVSKESWAKAACFLMLPTLLLDPFSCAFFRDVFPNVDPAAAGEFGGWMLICCGGAVGGALSKR